MESRSTLIFFTVYTLIVFFLYLFNQQLWTSKNLEVITQADSLQRKVVELQEALEQAVALEKSRREYIKAHEFDGFDATGFRVYGLLRDEEKKYTEVSAGQKFNVFPPSSIKVSDVLGERWLIVPVKGLHFVSAGESFGQIAKLYYRDAADSVLLREFNPALRVGRFIFIPFSKK